MKVTVWKGVLYSPEAGMNRNETSFPGWITPDNYRIVGLDPALRGRGFHTSTWNQRTISDRFTDPLPLSTLNLKVFSTPAFRFSWFRIS